MKFLQKAVECGAVGLVNLKETYKESLQASMQSYGLLTLGSTTEKYKIAVERLDKAERELNNAAALLPSMIKDVESKIISINELPGLSRANIDLIPKDFPASLDKDPNNLIVSLRSFLSNPILRKQEDDRQLTCDANGQISLHAYDPAKVASQQVRESKQNFLNSLEETYGQEMRNLVAARLHMDVNTPLTWKDVKQAMALINIVASIPQQKKNTGKSEDLFSEFSVDSYTVGDRLCNNLTGEEKALSMIGQDDRENLSDPEKIKSIFKYVVINDQLEAIEEVFEKEHNDLQMVRTQIYNDVDNGTLSLGRETARASRSRLVMREAVEGSKEKEVSPPVVAKAEIINRQELPQIQTRPLPSEPEERKTPADMEPSSHTLPEFEQSPQWLGGPPPPPTAPPPPAPGSSKVSQLSEEEKYNASENRRLDQKRVQRSSPNSFSHFVQDQSEILKARASFEAFAKTYKVAPNPETKKLLDTASEQLALAERGRASYLPPQDKKFGELLRGLTTPEVKIILGMFYDSNSDAQKPGSKELMHFYQNGGDLLSGKEAELFLKTKQSIEANKKDWIHFIGFQARYENAFLELLSNRQKDPNHFPEPNYSVGKFDPEKKVKISAPKISEDQQGKNVMGDVLAAIQGGGVRLNKVAATEKIRPEESNTQMRDLRGGLRKASAQKFTQKEFTDKEVSERLEDAIGVFLSQKAESFGVNDKSRQEKIGRLNNEIFVLSDQIDSEMDPDRIARLNKEKEEKSIEKELITASGAYKANNHQMAKPFLHFFKGDAENAAREKLEILGIGKERIENAIRSYNWG